MSDSSNNKFLKNYLKLIVILTVTLAFTYLAWERGWTFTFIISLLFIICPAGYLFNEIKEKAYTKVCALLLMFSVTYLYISQSEIFVHHFFTHRKCQQILLELENISDQATVESEFKKFLTEARDNPRIKPALNNLHKRLTDITEQEKK